MSAVLITIEIMSTKCQGTFPDTQIDQSCGDIATILLGVPCDEKKWQKNSWECLMGEGGVGHS